MFVGPSKDGIGDDEYTPADERDRRKGLSDPQ